MRRLRYWWNRMLSWWHDWPSWIVVYPDGHSRPLRRADALTRCELSGGMRVMYWRDDDGNLITGGPDDGQ